MFYIDALRELGLSETDSVTEDALRCAYRERAKQVHPDLNGGDVSAMQQLNLAKRIVATELKRRRDSALKLTHRSIFNTKLKA